MEVAFQAKLKQADGEVVLDDEWFSKRLEDCGYPFFLFANRCVDGTLGLIRKIC
jgi:hypothetical protein